MYKHVLPFLLLVCGCQTSQPSIQTVSPASDYARVTKVRDSRTPEMLDLESELTINFWLYLQQEETRLLSKLHNSKTNDAEKEAIQIFLSAVRAQSRETWGTLFQD